ncbi:MAG: HEAT repeat domain-containing protein [Planctomycetota bacterium]
MDFVRHEGLRRLLTEQEGKLVIDAYRNHPIGKASKEALAMAVAMSGHKGAGDALLESLLFPKSVRIRGAVGDALWRLKDSSVPGKLVGNLEEADPRHRATLVQVLGRVGKKPEAPAARKLLADPVADVRIEAAHALGRIARNAREDDPTARVGGRADLYRRVLLSKTKNELRACLWALAQLDDPEAFDLLRRLADKDDRPLVRRLAKSYLERPRVSLVLR